MNFHAVGVVYRKELTEWLRDRRTLISTVLVPLLAFPILISGHDFALRGLHGVGEKRNSQNHDHPRRGFTRPSSTTLKANKEIEVVPYCGQLERLKSPNKQIRAAVEIPKGFQASLEKGTPQTIQIHYYEGELKSRIRRRARREISERPIATTSSKSASKRKISPIP